MPTEADGDAELLEALEVLVQVEAGERDGDQRVQGAEHRHDAQKPLRRGVGVHRVRAGDQRPDQREHAEVGARDHEPRPDDGDGGEEDCHRCEVGGEQRPRHARLACGVDGDVGAAEADRGEQPERHAWGDGARATTIATRTRALPWVMTRTES